MYIAPNSTVKVLKSVPMDASHKNVIRFTSKSSQQDYFAGRAKYTFTDYSYIREQRKLRVGVKADNIYECNYLMYQNTSFGSKWFYAFITNIEYINNDVSEITFEIDDMQTWLLGVDYEIRPSFVEREHVSDDTVGAHLIDEGLAIGDYVTNTSSSKTFTDWWICVGSTVDLKKVAGEYTPEGGYVYAGIYSGVSWYCFTTDTAVWALPAIMKDLGANGKADAVVSMFMIPKDVVSTAQNDGGYLQASLREPEDVFVLYNGLLDGYIPRNKKLLTYPYKAMMLSNYEGNAITLRYEFFDDYNVPKIKYVGGIQPNSKIIAYPENYKGVLRNYNESISLGGYPQCCWQKEVYANWLASQTIRNEYTEQRFYRNAIPNFLGSAVKQGLAGGALAGGAGATAGIATAGAGMINSQLDMYSKMSEEKEVYSLVPNSVKGTIGNGSTNISIGIYGFKVEHRSIKKEIAQSIDDYFDLYGYKVNTVKVPNIGTRPHWNYVKTIGVTLVGAIPADSLVRLASIYDSGVTFWKNASEVGKYDLDNTI